MRHALLRLASSIVGCGRDHHRSNIDQVLRRSIGRDLAKTHIASVVDRRELIEQIEKSLSIRDSALLTKVAETYGLAIIHRIPALNNLALSQIQIFSKYGACPLFCDGMTVGVVCSNPDLVPALFEALGTEQKNRPPIYIGYWSMINTALEDALIRNPFPDDCGSSKLCSEILQILAKQALCYGAASVQLNLQSKSPCFEFDTAEGKLARGDIDRRVAGALGNFLERALTGDSEELTCIHSLVGDPLCTLSAAEPRLYKISWRDKARSDPVKQSEMALPRSLTRRERCPVLLIDDNSTFLNVLERVLTRQQIECVCACSAQQALALIADPKRQFGAIVCDVHMPRMSGFDLLKHLSQQGLRPAPVIMLTSDEDVETELKLISLGASVYLAKSEDPRVLCAYITNYLNENSDKVAA